MTSALNIRNVWRASQMSAPHTAVNDSGFKALNAQLPGAGWPAGMLTELITRHAGVGELRLLVPVLRQLTQARKMIILLAPPMIPYAPALASFGIDLNFLIIIQASNAADRLWAVEQTLKSASFGALLAWLPEQRTRPEHLRRMQLAAQTATGPVFLFRELQAQFQPSPAPLRLLLLPRPNEQISVQILKRRGPVMATPIMLDLPRPAASIGLKASLLPASTEPVTLSTVHSQRQPHAPIDTPDKRTNAALAKRPALADGPDSAGNTNKQLSLLN